MCTFHFGKCNPSHTHRCLEFPTPSGPGSLILVGFPHRLHDLWSYFSTTPKTTVLAGVSKMVKFRHFGGYPRKWPKMHILGGVIFDPQIRGIELAKNPFRGAQLYGDTRRIIYCLDTRYGTPKPCFWCQNTSTRQNRGFWENRVFDTFFAHFAKLVHFWQIPKMVKNGNI